MSIPEWWAEGDLFEGCNCDSVCPCHVAFRQKSTYETCDGAWGIHVDRGGHGGVELNGLNALVVTHCPGPSMFDGNWTALIYTDDQATPDQCQALVDILTGVGGGPWAKIAQFFADGKPKAIQTAAFKFAKEGRKRSLAVAGVATLEVEAIRGANPDEEVKITNLYNVIHGPEHVIARSRLAVDTEGLQWDNSGKHGLYSRFRWSN